MPVYHYNTYKKFLPTAMHAYRGPHGLWRVDLWPVAVADSLAVVACNSRLKVKVTAVNRD